MTEPPHEPGWGDDPADPLPPERTGGVNGGGIALGVLIYLFGALVAAALGNATQGMSVPVIGLLLLVGGIAVTAMCKDRFWRGVGVGLLLGWVISSLLFLGACFILLAAV